MAGLEVSAFQRDFFPSFWRRYWTRSNVRECGELPRSCDAAECVMLDQTYNVPQSAGEILGDLTALTEQLGGTEGLIALSSTHAWHGITRVDSVPALESFLNGYRSDILIAHELPAVIGAYNHFVRSEIRELIALDKSLANVPALRSFAAASCAVGRTQLRRLRPLRGERVLQRYARAVEQQETKAWHTIVYGLVLGIYSLPLRQGLVHFAQQTLGGFVHAAGQRLRLTEADRHRLLSAQSTPASSAVEQALAGASLACDLPPSL